jgi:hypothetical protein
MHADKRWLFKGAGSVLAVGLVVSTGAIAAGARVGSQAKQPRPLSSVAPYIHQVTNINFPAPYLPTASFDIGFVDSTTHTYYLADRTNAGVDAVNTATDTFGGVIGAGQFVGPSPTVTAAQKTACGTSTAGPNGVLSLTVSGSNQVWAADGVSATAPVSNVKVYTMSSGTAGALAATIPTGNSTFGTSGVCRADEMAYDPTDNLVIVANDVDSPPYLSLISVSATPSQDAVVAQIKFPNATGGIEQSAYDAATGMFYSNIPGVELAVIDPKTKAIAATYSEPNCVSSGLTLDPTTQQLLVSCGINPLGSMLMSAKTGAVLARFPQISGADEIWYDSGSNNFYLGANRMTSNGSTTGFATPAIGVISAGGTKTQTRAAWVENVPAGATTANNHSVAADPTNHQIFVPIASYGIAVFAKNRTTTGL